MSNDAVDLRAGLTTPKAAAEGVSEADRRQVKNLAEQFEAMLMTQMLRDMRKSMLSGLDDGNKADGFGSDALTDTIDVQLGLALSRAGGFGLSSVLLTALERMTGTDASTGGRAFALPAAALPAYVPAADAPSAFAPTGISAAIESALSTVAGDAGPRRDAGADALVYAPQGRVSSTFGWRNDPLTGASRFHQGVDIAMPVGRDVVAAERGRVAFSGEQSGFGNTILIDHGNGRQTRYAHLSEQAVRAGTEVSAGQLIGKSGATGRVTGPHLHFEVLVNGKPVNPTD